MFYAGEFMTIVPDEKNMFYAAWSMSTVPGVFNASVPSLTKCSMLVNIWQ